MLESRPGRVLAGVLVLHTATWTLVPALVNPNLPLDVVESLTWGHAWEWGYFKHPPLSPWLAELAYSLAPGQGWPIYLLSALCVTVAFWAVWRLARDFVAPLPAAIAVLLLEGIHYHNFSSQEFNANIVLLPFWALTILFFWRAVARARPLDWVLFGLFGALALLGKYFAAFLIAPLGLYLLLERAGRAAWRTPGPYLALGVAMLVLAPHVVWMVGSDFATITYAVARSTPRGHGVIAEHVVSPAKFLFAQAGAILPMVVLAVMLGRLRPATGAPSRETRFLLYAGLGPLILVVAVSAIFGLRLRSMWGAPLFLIYGLMIMTLFAPAKYHLRRFAWTWAGLFALAPSVYVAVVLAQPYVIDRPKRVHFPGRALAERVEAAWRDRFAQPLPIVVGTKWIAGNVAAYDKARPQVYLDADPARAPWLDDATVNRVGGAAVWKRQTSEGAASAPDSWQKRFPCLEVLPPFSLSWQTGAQVTPLSFGWGLIAPAESCPKTK